jgi:hypothetical protein
MYDDERGRHGWLPEQCHRRALWRILKCEYASGRKGSCHAIESAPRTTISEAALIYRVGFLSSV